MKTNAEIRGQIDAILQQERVRVGLERVYESEEELFVEYELREHENSVLYVLFVSGAHPQVDHTRHVVFVCVARVRE